MHPRARRFTTAVALAIPFVACSSATETKPESRPGDGVVLPDGTVFTRHALLEAVSACVLQNARELETRAGAFATAAAAAKREPTQRPAAQAAWREVTSVLQRLEPMQIGPAAPATQPGGVGLRDEIYVWPLTSTCTTDGYLVASTYETRPRDVLASGRGLGAAEYLLFSESAATTCAAGTETHVAWATLDAQTIAARRAAYASFVADDVAAWSTKLVEAWDPAQGDFTRELTSAGDGSRTFTQDRIAINAVSDALFYVEWATKDLKLGRPAGVTQCDAATCPAEVESPFAGRSLQHVRDNLVGLRMIFTGCGEDAKGLGFDDFLVAVGQADVAATIDRDIVAAIAAIDALGDRDLAVAVTSDLPAVLAAHQALKQVTNVLRTDFVTLLDLELPKRVEGDND